MTCGQQLDCPVRYNKMANEMEMNHTLEGVQVCNGHQSAEQAESQYMEG
jgi:hypothetical protein